MVQRDSFKDGSSGEQLKMNNYPPKLQYLNFIKKKYYLLKIW